jgi:hypothetical protein
VTVGRHRCDGDTRISWVDREAIPLRVCFDSANWSRRMSFAPKNRFHARLPDRGRGGVLKRPPGNLSLTI